MRHDEPDRLLDRVADELRKPVPLDPWLDARIMRAVRAQRAPRGLGAVVAWLRRPHWFAVTPLQAAAALAVLVGVVTAGGALRQAGGGPPPTVAATVQADTESSSVTFLFHAPGADHVALVGSFNGWDGEATPMRPLPGGVWRIEVHVPPGRHLYSFLIDGTEWAPDPAAPRTAEEDFGHATSVLVVPGVQS